jgi:RNA polymerase sigma-70 factor (ECF subfamily)
VDRVRADARRRERDERSARADMVADYDLDLEAHDLTVADQVREAVNTLNYQVRYAMGYLNDAERAAIELAYFGGHTYREVARILGQPEGTVKSRIRTGLMRLRTQLLDRGIDESWIVN